MADAFEAAELLHLPCSRSNLASRGPTDATGCRRTHLPPPSLSTNRPICALQLATENA